MVNSNQNQSKKFDSGEGTFEFYLKMVIFSVLQSGFSYKLTILTKILFRNLCWLLLIITREFNSHSKSGLGSKIRFSMQRYTKNTRIVEKSDVLKNDLFLNSHENFGRF
jgi:hypothetical protein